ncbi:MAG: hypothetical protein NPIRA02_07720 [Nitrospirales bacterium]|nr:MAG: hypothetical protein NPIRA02_07720 [Nitrospirales bacterium]
MTMSEYPRSPKIQVGGLCHLGRLFDKIRMRHRGLIQDYHYLTTGFDKYLLETIQVNDEELEKQVLKGRTDEELLAWINENGKILSEEERAQWNTMVLTGKPQNEQARQRFHGLVEALAKSREISVAQLPELLTWVDVIECDEGRL